VKLPTMLRRAVQMVKGPRAELHHYKGFRITLLTRQNAEGLWSGQADVVRWGVDERQGHKAFVEIRLPSEQQARSAALKLATHWVDGQQ
jgi:hypothetical protein